MKFTIAVLLVLMSGLSTFDKVEDRVNLEWNYEYSSDVLHAVLIENSVATSNGGKCNVPYSKFRVIEAFKGKLKVDEVFSAAGISTHEYREEGTEQFLLLKPFVAKRYPGYGDCSNEDYARFLSIHNWCCSINNDQERSFVMYDMLNSEQAGEHYFVPVSDTFRELRKLEESYNDSTQSATKALAD